MRVLKTLAFPQGYFWQPFCLVANACSNATRNVRIRGNQAHGACSKKRYPR